MVQDSIKVILIPEKMAVQLIDNSLLRTVCDLFIGAALLSVGVPNVKYKPRLSSDNLKTGKIHASLCQSFFPPETNMRISLVQYAPVWEDRRATKDKLSMMLEVKLSTDWLIFPEMSLSGFTNNILASSWDEKDFNFFSTLAQNQSCWITVGGVQDGQNKAFVFKPTGTLVTTYAKRHLFSHADEEATYRPGSDRKHYQVGTESSIMVAQAICYDLRFPYHFWADAPFVDAYCVIAAWGKSRADQWRSLLKARAIENQAFMIGVNRIGIEPEAAYSGDSSVIDPWGKELLYCGDSEGIFSIDIDITTARKWRENFPVINDRLE